MDKLIINLQRVTRVDSRYPLHLDGYEHKETVGKWPFKKTVVSYEKERTVCGRVRIFMVDEDGGITLNCSTSEKVDQCFNIISEAIKAGATFVEVDISDQD